MSRRDKHPSRCTRLTVVIVGLVAVASAASTSCGDRAVDTVARVPARCIMVVIDQP
jgi:hypothetical protein